MTNDRDGLSIAAIVFTVGAVATWGFTFLSALGNRGEVADMANDASLSPSAIQISQVVDEATLDVLPWLVASCALSVTAGFLIGFLILRRLTPTEVSRSGELA